MAMDLIGLAPLGLVVALVVLAGYGAVDDSFNRRLTRFARRFFGRYVTPSPERARVLESAYIGETYRGYAARTLLFTVIAALCGALGGPYVFGLLLLSVPALVELLLGLPETMVLAIGVRGFELVLTPTQTLGVLVAGGVLTGTGLAGIVYYLRWTLPKNTAEGRRRAINEGMPRNLAFMYALSRGGMEFADIVRILATNRAVYGATASEVAIAVRQMDLFGEDVITSLGDVAERTPSETFKTFAENLSSVLQSGRSLPSFFRAQYERHQEAAEQRQADVLENLATVAEAYVTIFVAGVLFLITILLVFGLTTSDTLPLLRLLAYVAIPLANVGFVVYLSEKLDVLGMGDQGTTSVLDGLDTAVHGRPGLQGVRTGLADGGSVADSRANWQRLRFHDRLRVVRAKLRSPIETLRWHPTSILPVVVPLAVVVFALRAPAVVLSNSIHVRLLDDLLVQSTLLVLGSFALVQSVYKRRIAAIEDATPDLLERLASLNEAGMTVVESLRRVRKSDVGALSPELRRIWADITMGANAEDALIRFGRRIRTAPITRTVTLLTHSMRASGNLGPVLRVAATQARADLRLKKRRRQQMLTYLVVIYVAFVVFLVIIVAVQEVLVPSLPSYVPTPPEDNRLGVSAQQFTRLGGVDKAAYTLVFFHTALIQAVLTGFIGGQLGEGTLKDGAKHAAVLLGVAYVAFLVLSSPVASVAVGQPTVADGELTFDSASLSAGGFVVVHQNGVDGPVVGATGYLEPGTHDDPRIALDASAPALRTITVVVYQDTNGNGVFDHPNAAGTDPPDAPYPAAGRQDIVAITFSLR